MTDRNPEPLDESLPPPEIRGGNRPEDFMGPYSSGDVTWAAFSAALDPEEAFDDEPLDGNDPDAQ